MTFCEIFKTKVLNYISKQINLFQMSIYLFSEKGKEEVSLSFPQECRGGHCRPAAL